MRVLVTGGAGFIGSSVVRHLIQTTSNTILNVDNLSYAGNLASLKEVSASERYSFSQLDIRDGQGMYTCIANFKPNLIMHLAAESHVDRSIEGPKTFIDTNIMGTFALLEASRSYWSQLSEQNKKKFRFHHISTDEVFGDLGGDSDSFTEETRYAPSSPYSASKASSDHLVRAWHRTYGLPTVISNCSNNYGPNQFPEKFIPHIILSALSGEPLPVYGDGAQTRDWLYVEDHARALELVATKGQIGETYNIGGNNQRKNIQVVREVCHMLEELQPEKPERVVRYEDLISFVADRPGHDRRYAVNTNKIEAELRWEPKETFQTGLRKTVVWYLNNSDWWKSLMSGEYRLRRFGSSSKESLN